MGSNDDHHVSYQLHMLKILMGLTQITIVIKSAFVQKIKFIQRFLFE